MPSALTLRSDYSAADLRQLAKRTKDNNQSRRLLSLAAVLEGMNRTDAARIGGMDRQTLRDWVHRFNQRVIECHLDRDTPESQGRIEMDQGLECSQSHRAAGINDRGSGRVPSTSKKSGSLAIKGRGRMPIPHNPPSSPLHE